MDQNKTTRDYISDGLNAYKKLAKHSLKSRWKKMNLHEKCEAARSLVVMGIVAKEPDCFSRAKTQSSWKMRAMEYSKEHNFAPEDYWHAFYFVQGPKEIVWYQVMPAMVYPLLPQYYNFLGYIQNYEYDNSSLKENYAREIKDEAKRVCDITNTFEFKMDQANKKIKQLYRNIKRSVVR